MILKKNGPQGFICPHFGAISVYMYINIIFKHLFRNRWTNKSQILYETSIGGGNQCLYYINESRSHDKDDYHAHIHVCKNVKSFSFVQ